MAYYKIVSNSIQGFHVTNNRLEYNSICPKNRYLKTIGFLARKSPKKSQL
jgi:hypothetical protein